MTVATDGGESRAWLTVGVECVDCHRMSVVPVAEPVTRYYQGGVLEKLGLSSMSVPEGWHTTGSGACQIERCATCFDAYEAVQRPAREARAKAYREHMAAAREEAAAARRAELESKTLVQLLEEMISSSQASRDQLEVVLRKVRGALAIIEPAEH